MQTSAEWQLDINAADKYHHILVPYILGPAAFEFIEWCHFNKDTVILDAGCGTGTAARYASLKAGPKARVTGVDINEGMLQTARGIPSAEETNINYFRMDIVNLDFRSGSFDNIICAQSLQFFKEKEKALKEMIRVLKPGGEIFISVWSSKTENPYFNVLAESVSMYLGGNVSSALTVIFSLSDTNEIYRLLENAGYININIAQKEIYLRLPDLHFFIPEYIGATPMAEAFNAADKSTRDLVVQRTAENLEQYKNEEGVLIPFRIYLIKGQKQD